MATFSALSVTAPVPGAWPGEAERIAYLDAERTLRSASNLLSFTQDEVRLGRDWLWRSLGPEIREFMADHMQAQINAKPLPPTNLVMADIQSFSTAAKQWHQGSFQLYTKHFTVAHFMRPLIDLKTRLDISEPFRIAIEGVIAVVEGGALAVLTAGKGHPVEMKKLKALKKKLSIGSPQTRPRISRIR